MKVTAKQYARSFPIQSATDQYDKELLKTIERKIIALFSGIAKSGFGIKLALNRYRSSNCILITLIYVFNDGMTIDKQVLHDYIISNINLYNADSKATEAKLKLESVYRKTINIEEKILVDGDGITYAQDSKNPINRRKE